MERKRIWTFIGSSFVLMLVAAFVDNARGPLLPVLTRVLQLPYGAASGFFIAGNAAAVVGLFVLIPLIRHFGERRLAITSTLVALAIPAAAQTVTSLPTLLVFGALVGGAVALLGALSNVLVIQGSDEASRARYFCGLHMLYGFGSLAAPPVVGMVLGAGLPWQASFWLPMLPAAGLLYFFVFHFRLTPRSEAATAVPATFGTGQVLAILVMSLYVIAETLTTSWMVAFLVDGRAFTVAGAAPYLSGFFLLMGVTRALCFLWLPLRWEQPALWFSLAFPVAALALGHAGHLWALPLAALCGPFFPVMMARISRAFPAQSRPLTLAILAVVQTTLALAQWGMGALTDGIGVGLAYRAPVFFFVATSLALWLWRVFAPR